MKANRQLHLLCPITDPGTNMSPCVIWPRCPAVPRQCHSFQAAPLLQLGFWSDPFHEQWRGVGSCSQHTFVSSFYLFPQGEPLSPATQCKTSTTKFWESGPPVRLQSHLSVHAFHVMVPYPYIDKDISTYPYVERRI